MVCNQLEDAKNGKQNPLLDVKIVQVYQNWK